MKKIEINKFFLKFLFSLWFFFLIFPIIFIENYWVMLDLRSENIYLPLKIASLLIFITYVLFFLKIEKRITSVDLKIGFFVLFLFFCVISSLWSIKTFTTFGNAILLFFFYLAFIKTQNFISFKDLFKFIPVIISSIIIISIFKYSLVGRNIGGIQPNLISQFCFVGIVMSMISYDKKIKNIYIIFFITIIFLLNSRLYLILSFLSLIIFLILNGDTKRNIKYLFYFLFIIVIFVLLFSDLYKVSISYILDNVLLIDDPDRGIDSGFTNRTYYWKVGLELFEEKKMFGYGFRSRENILSSNIENISSHSGFINLLLDVGLVGTILFFLSLAASMIKRIKLIYIQKKLGYKIDNFNLVIISNFPGIILHLIFEPVHFYIGVPFFYIMLMFVEGEEKLIDVR
jgi:O-antigen ligase